MRTHPSVESTLLFALGAYFGRAVPLVVGGAPHALAAHECCGQLAVLAAGGLAVLRHVRLAPLADRARLALAENIVV